MKPSEALRELSQVLKAEPALDPSLSVISVVKADVFISALSKMKEFNLGYPLFCVPMGDGVLMRFPMEDLASFTVHVKSQDGKKITEALRGFFNG